MIQGNGSVEYNCKLRVLVVVSDPARRAAIVHKLEQRFSDIFTAEGQGPALLAHAAELVLARRCHAVVVAVDVAALPDDQTSSLGPQLDLDALSRQLEPAGIVICALQPDDRLAFRAGQRGMEYVRYDDPASDLCAAVEARGRQGCHCTLAVRWPGEDFADHVADKLKYPRGAVTTEDLYDLMGRLYPRSSGVALKPLPSLTTMTLIASAVRRSVVLWASERHPIADGQQIPKVIKIGPADEIARERLNYERYVQGWLQLNRQARLEDYARLWHLGAITYAFLGVQPHDMVPFRHFYLKRTSREILHVLRRLFGETCRNWYEKERQRVDGMRLFALYDDALNLRARLEERLDTENPYLAFPGIEEPLPNPALWALDVGRRATPGTITTAITHGDLHGDNFFVDRNQQAWLIDFGQTGPGHALRDFVELEADIKLRLTTFTGGDLSALAMLEEALLGSDTLDGMLLPSAGIAANRKLHKAFEVIAGLRHLAFVTTGVFNAREYYEALLYETLLMATMRRLHKSVRLRALLSAALIARRLKANGAAGETGLPAAIPRLDVDALNGHGPARIAGLVHEHQEHLQLCLDALLLQKVAYDGEPPQSLIAGIESLMAEQTRARGNQAQSNRSTGGLP